MRHSRLRLPGAFVNQVRRLVPEVEDQKCRRSADRPAGAEIFGGSSMALGQPVAIKRRGSHSDDSSGDGTLHIARRLDRHGVEREVVKMTMHQSRIGAEVPNIEFRNRPIGLPMREIGEPLAPIVIRIADDFVSRPMAAPDFVDESQTVGPNGDAVEGHPADPDGNGKLDERATASITHPLCDSCDPGTEPHRK